MTSAAASLPSLYISHGSPMTALEPGAAGAFWRQLGPALDARFGRPQAILAVSAHSLTRSPVLLAAARHEAIYDFGGFPDALYQLRYDAPGAPTLANEVARLLSEAGLPIQISPEGGMDHGIWTPLRSMYPNADVPVLPLAWPPHWSPQQLITLGQALAPLAAQGVLIMGSGAITHNLGLFARGQRELAAPEWTETASFRQWMRDRLQAADWAALADYRSQAPHASLMHPSDEHLLPLMVAAGAGGAQAGQPGLRLHGSVTYGHMGMDAYAFGPRAPELVAELAADLATDPTLVPA